ncbi:hypothetical protein ACJX0J_032413, partial [Zea mays]
EAENMYGDEVLLLEFECCFVGCIMAATDNRSFQHLVSIYKYRVCHTYKPCFFDVNEHKLIYPLLLTTIAHIYIYIYLLQATFANPQIEEVDLDLVLVIHLQLVPSGILRRFQIKLYTSTIHKNIIRLPNISEDLPQPFSGTRDLVTRNMFLDE